MKMKDMIALTPPMGWNSWDCFGNAVNEEQLLANAPYMKERLLPYGWEYVVCDIQWSEPTVIEKAWHLRENANLWRSLTLRMRRLTWVRSSLCSGFPGALPRGISGRGRRSGRFPAGSGPAFRRTGRRCLR